jgi:hypothetical protein
MHGLHFKYFLSGPLSKPISFSSPVCEKIHVRNAKVRLGTSVSNTIIKK